MKLSSIIENLRSSQYLSHIGWLVRGNLLAQVIQIASLPLLSRIYTPAHFGIFAVFMAFLGIASVSLSLRLESAILIADEDECADLVALTCRLVVVVSVLLSALLFALQTNDVLGHGILPVWSVFLAFLTMVGVGVFGVGRAVKLREGDARLLARAPIDRAAGNVATKIGIGLLVNGSGGLLIGETVGAWLAIRRVGSGLILRSSLFLNGKAAELGRAWRNYRRFPYLEFPSSLMNQAASVLPVPMLAELGGAEAAGAYGVARMVVVLPNAQVGRAVGDSFQLRVARMVREGEVGTVRAVFWKTAAGLAATGFVPYLLLALLSEWAFPLLLGAEWKEAGQYASLLAIWMYLGFVVSPLSRMLPVFQRQEMKLIYDLVVVMTVVGLFVYSSWHDAGAYAFVKALVLINAAAYLLYLGLLAVVARQGPRKSYPAVG